MMAAAVLLLLGAVSSSFAEPIVVAVQGPETAADKRYEYDHAVIRLALEKTRADYGAFELRETAVGQNSKRALTAVVNGYVPNYVIKTSASNDLVGTVGIVPFPVDLGIVGYRVAFVSRETKKQLASVGSARRLKTFDVVQGIGWLDSKILQHHGFNVQTVGDYANMFKMVALNRMEVFFRGANELEAEWAANRHIPNLAYDEAVAVYYPLPRFLVTSKSNPELASRLHDGLIRAYEDGSLVALWESKYLSSVEFANLADRQIFPLSNPYLSRIDPLWEKYVYRPVEERRSPAREPDREAASVSLGE